jgi:hypothetical protein
MLHAGMSGQKPVLGLSQHGKFDVVCRAYALANRPVRFIVRICQVSSSKGTKDHKMSYAIKIAVVATILATLGGISDEASARERLYPLTRCGPDLAYLCPIHGYFDQPPFHYNLAIHPGCIKVVRVATPYGSERRRTIVCGAPERPMVWW